MLQQDDCTKLMDLLQQLGVEVVQASKFTMALLKRLKTTFIDLIGQGRIVEAAAHSGRRPLHCHGLAALDLRSLKPNRQPWDATVQADISCRTESRDTSQTG